MKITSKAVGIIILLTINALYLCVGLQVVVEDVYGYCQVSCVEWILPVPALRTELPPLRHTGMEVTQREEDGLKLLLTTALVQNVLERSQSMNT